MPTFRKRPTLIEAVQFTEGNAVDVEKWCGGHIRDFGNYGAVLTIPTLEGEMACFKNDWVVRGSFGEFYPINRVIFEKTHDPSSDELVTTYDAGRM